MMWTSSNWKNRMKRSSPGRWERKEVARQEAAAVKTDYRAIEDEKLEKDKKNAKAGINSKVQLMHDIREGSLATWVR